MKETLTSLYGALWIFAPLDIGTQEPTIFQKPHQFPCHQIQHTCNPISPHVTPPISLPMDTMCHKSQCHGVHSYECSSIICNELIPKVLIRVQLASS
jgi:hypothetical protein